MKKLLIVGILFRIVVMSVTAHFDFWFLITSGYLWVEKGIINMYEYYTALPFGESFIEGFRNVFLPYPPLIVYTFGLWTKLITSLVQRDFLEQVTVNLLNIYSYPDLIWHIFLYKLIYLFFDLGILWLLTKFFTDIRQKKTIALLWLFNPASFHALAQGNFDLLPLFFTVISLYAAQKGKYYWSALALGIGAAYKLFPLLLLPLLVLSVKKNLLHQIKIVFITLLPFIATALPFWLSAGYDPLIVLSQSTTNLFAARIVLSPQTSISIVAGLLAMLYLWFHFHGRREELWKYYLCALLVVFSFTDFHMQWFVWLTPFLFLEQILHQFRYRLPGILLIGCWLIFLAFSTADLHLGLFIPLKTLGLFSHVPPLIARDVTPAYNPVIQKTIGVDLPFLARSLFVAVSMVYIILLLNNNQLPQQRGDQSRKRYLNRV